MTAAVYLVEAPDAADVLRDGAAHPVLGGLIDLGTSVRLTPGSALSGPGADGAGTLRDAIAAVCADLEPKLTVLRRSGTLTADLRGELETRGAEHPVVVVLFLPGDAALVVAAGPDLPAMGALPDGDLAALRASLLTVLGEPSGGDDFFSEPHFAFDDERERDLNDRLRQLYGE
ncbi:hypothetical protein [Actinomadura terrae]|uniref:hypothetical protein n=1 Tax=Actinomadura terrae TaxID=604353 RepID=UPI001FA76607|nr:hypothetical protein [Actinomadura terrae]